MNRALLICLAGAAGTGARYWAGLVAPRVLGTGFPYGTLAVNVVGSFILAIIVVLGGAAGILSPTARLVLGTGFCGGFTTYSTFNYETMAYLHEGAVRLTVTNVLVTLVACMAAGLAGWGLATWAV